MANNTDKVLEVTRNLINHPDSDKRLWLTPTSIPGEYTFNTGYKLKPDKTEGGIISDKTHFTLDDIDLFKFLNDALIEYNDDPDAPNVFDTKASYGELWNKAQDDISKDYSEFLKERGINPYRYEPYFLTQEALEWYKNGKRSPMYFVLGDTDYMYDLKKKYAEIGENMAEVSNNNFLRSTPYLSPSLARENPELAFNTVRANARSAAMPFVMAGTAAAPAVPWTSAINTGGKFLSKYVIAPYLAGEAVNETLKLFTGTTLSDLISNYLQNNKGWNPIAALFTGDMFNPGYWINFGGGTYTKPLLLKLGIAEIPTRINPSAAITNSVYPKSKFLTNYVLPFTLRLNDIRNNGLKFGNNYYKPTYTPLGTLSSGGLGELSGLKIEKTPATNNESFFNRFYNYIKLAFDKSKLQPILTLTQTTPAWLLENFPGFLIKSLLKGSPLEKQLSKLGTISLKLLQAYIGRNDVPNIDKELIGKVLLNHTNDTHIDYNTLRSEVLNMIPEYNIVPADKYANYGVDRLGFRPNYNVGKWRSEYPIERFIPSIFKTKPKDINPYEEVKLNTITFESPGIAGNPKHYNNNTLGHSRTYTTTDEPDILYIMESQSDWAQHPKNSENTLILDYMQKTYLLRLLLENLKYAAKNGQTKMRYPTPDTAAKIEGYKKTLQKDVIIKAQDKYLELFRLADDRFLLYKMENELTNDEAKHLLSTQHADPIYTELLKKLEEASKAYRDALSSPEEYKPTYQTILKKYKDFPKLYKKLFKVDPIIVTDSKGNTWYEVDVPQSYLDGSAEMLFKKGGSLIDKFKQCRHLMHNK